MTNLKELNEYYSSYSIYKRVEELYKDFDANDIMLTSVFSAYSAFLLKVISEVYNSQPIYFIDTGHQFDETIEHKDYLTNLFILNVVSISAKVEVQVKCSEQELWLHKPNECCYFNMDQPLEKIK